MARAPVGNAKTHSTPSHYDGVEHKWWLPSPPPPPPPPPWASRRRPRHHIRRRLRRAARCVGAFPAAPAQHARALRAIDPCLNGEDGMALQRLAARYRPAALRQPDLERGSARWAVDLEPGGGRRRAKAARHGRRTTARAERERTGPFPWEKLLKNPEALRAPLILTTCSLFLPTPSYHGAHARLPRCGRLQARRRTELLPTISLFAIDLPAPFAARLDARALRRSCARTPKSGQLVPAARIDGAERARVLCRCGGEGADAARCAAQPAPNVVPRPAA
jgi:hypothetical protein